VYQPITCQQCETAPCEQVCPVAATVHTKEGLNDMVYNRCIGTRYCSNNCPYKVRRFNFFNYFKDMEKPENEVRKMLFNPEVTVRARGVMEKCTFCVQRIVTVRIKANNENKRPIQDLEIRTACQEACSAEAIVFGDLSDKDSLVAKKHASPRSYKLLDEMLNTRPRNVFLSRVRNPHPALYEPKSNYVKAKAHKGEHGAHGHDDHDHDHGHGAKPEAPKGEAKTEGKAH
jgi:molybdopterin-containing oxidoreductase family iron-sulfur binding subunit